MKIWLVAGLLLASVVGLVNPVVAGPTRIQSESLVIDHQNNRAEFKGAVRLQRDGFELRSDRLVVLYRERGNGELERAEAYGNVVMRQGEKHGVADRAIYNQREGMLILMGGASVEDASGMVRGEKLIHYLDSRQTVAEQGGSGGRARLRLEEEQVDKMVDEKTKPESVTP